LFLATNDLGNLRVLAKKNKEASKSLSLDGGFKKRADGKTPGGKEEVKEKTGKSQTKPDVGTCSDAFCYTEKEIPEEAAGRGALGGVGRIKSRNIVMRDHKALPGRDFSTRTVKGRDTAKGGEKGDRKDVKRQNRSAHQNRRNRRGDHCRRPGITCR